MSNEPFEPDYACPTIDQAIAEMEEVRLICEKLRAWGQWWKDKAEELQIDNTELERERDKLNDRVTEADDYAHDLEKEVEQCNSIIESLKRKLNSTKATQTMQKQE